MNKSNPWAFGIIFIIISIFILTNETNWSLYFTRNKKETKAYVYKTKVGYGTAGKGYKQFVHYTYEVDGKMYKDWKKIGNKYVWQHIGNTLTVKYAVDNPKNNQVIQFYNEYSQSKEAAYLSLKKQGYYQIELINGLYFFKDYGKEGKLLREETGTYERTVDTFSLKPFLSNDIKVFVLNKKDELIDQRLGIIYK